VFNTKEDDLVVLLVEMVVVLMLRSVDKLRLPFISGARKGDPCTRIFLTICDSGFVVLFVSWGRFSSLPRSTGRERSIVLISTALLPFVVLTS